MDLSVWELLTLLSKLAFYAGTAAVLGSLFQFGWFYDGSRRHLNYLLAYGLLGAVVGFHGALFAFLSQVALLSDSGVSGLFDWGMATILLDTPQGDAAFWRLLGFTAFILLAAFSLWRIQSLRDTPDVRFRRLLISAGLLIAIILAGSYRLLGHVSVLGTAQQLGQFVHVLMVSVWVGSFLPLLWLSRHQEATVLRLTMRRFGQMAVYVVGGLLLAGLLMLFGLLQSPAELLSTSYGLALLVKLLFVLGLLGLAALNRQVLVPALNSRQSVGHLQHSIQLELLTASVILALTAYLSTVVGPMGDTMGAMG